MPFAGARTVTAALTAAFLGLSVTGCGKADPAGDAGDAVPSLVWEGTATASPTQAPLQPAAGYPDTAKQYADEILAAWAAGDNARLGALTTALAQQQLLDETGGPPNMQWTLIRCDGAAGSTYCRYFNQDGHEIRLKITNQKLGGPDACGEVVYQVTPFPKEGKAYVKVLIEAWRDNNRPRMKLLARPQVLEDMTPGWGPPDGYVLSDGPPGGAGLHVVIVSAGPGYNPLELHVGTTLLGGPKAVVGLF